MGLFSRLKANMKHGGVKVQVSAPSSSPSNQVIPVQVTLTADSPQAVTSVKVEIKAQAKEQGMSVGVGSNTASSSTQTVAVAESREPLSLNPGEPQTITLELFINGNAASGNPLAALGNAGGALGGMLQTVVAAAQNFNHINYIYTVHAYADVEGIAMDPSDKQSIQILPPTETAQQPTTTVVGAAAVITQPAAPAMTTVTLPNVSVPQVQQPSAPPTEPTPPASSQQQ